MDHPHRGRALERRAARRRAHLVARPRRAGSRAREPGSPGGWPGGRLWRGGRAPGTRIVTAPSAEHDHRLDDPPGDGGREPRSATGTAAAGWRVILPDAHRRPDLGELQRRRAPADGARSRPAAHSAGRGAAGDDRLLERAEHQSHRPHRAGKPSGDPFEPRGGAAARAYGRGEPRRRVSVGERARHQPQERDRRRRASPSRRPRAESRAQPAAGGAVSARGHQDRRLDPLYQSAWIVRLLRESGDLRRLPGLHGGGGPHGVARAPVPRRGPPPRNVASAPPRGAPSGSRPFLSRAG